MARVGMFKAGKAHITVWQNNEELTFRFTKCVKDRSEWREIKTIYANELTEIGNLFLRAAEWSRLKQCAIPLPKGVAKVSDVLNGVTIALGGKNGTSEKLER